MNGDPLNLRSLLDLANDSSAESRKTLVNVITDLFSTGSSVLSERERALMSDILSKLVGDFELAVRRELAARLADNPSVPRDLVMLLAKDDIDVAHPILFRSTVLNDDELIEIIRHRTLEHQLAIAMRRNLSARVSDALAETENVDVVTTLLRNENAEISEATLEYLVEQSKRVDAWQEPLLRRDDLAPRLASRMYWWVSAALRAYIVRNFEIDPAELDDQIEEVVHSLTGEVGRTAGAEPESHAERLARRMTRDRMITPELLVRTLRQGEVALFALLFGELTRLRPERVRKLLQDPTAHGLAIACRAARIDRSSFASIYLLRYQSGDARVRDPRDLTRVLKLFDSISLADAAKVLDLWHRNPHYLEAIERVGSG